MDQTLYLQPNQIAHARLMFDDSPGAPTNIGFGGPRGGAKSHEVRHVAIANLGQPLGSHLFMATAQDEDTKTLRWTVVSMPSTLPAKSQWVASAKEAFDRLEIPKEAVDRVSALMSVGATVIVTDQGFSRHPSGLDSDYMISTL